MCESVSLFLSFFPSFSLSLSFIRLGTRSLNEIEPSIQRLLSNVDKSNLLTVSHCLEISEDLAFRVPGFAAPFILCPFLGFCHFDESVCLRNWESLSYSRPSMCLYGNHFNENLLIFGHVSSEASREK